MGPIRQLFALLLCASVLPAGLSAQQAVETPPVESKAVTLHDDGTTRVADPQAADCELLMPGFTFCPPDALPLDKQEATGPFVLADYIADNNMGVVFLGETKGRDDGTSPDSMRAAVIENVALATEVAPTDIPVIDVQATLVDDQPAETLVYLARFDGNAVVYANTMVLTDNTSLQIVVLAFEDTYTPEQRDLVETVNDAVQINLSEMK